MDLNHLKGDKGALIFRLGIADSSKKYTRNKNKNKTRSVFYTGFLHMKRYCKIAA